MLKRLLTYCLLLLPVCTVMADGVDLLSTDSMSLAYEGNRLVSVSDEDRQLLGADLFGFSDGADALVEYEYDGNGNTVKDLNRKISSIQYNSLNLRQRREDGLHLSKEQAYINFSSLFDQASIEYQIKKLAQAFNAVLKNLGSIPQRYKNDVNALGSIVNYVYQGKGVEDNKEIEILGQQILQEEGRYDEKKQVYIPFEVLL